MWIWKIKLMNETALFHDFRVLKPCWWKLESRELWGLDWWLVNGTLLGPCCIHFHVVQNCRFRIPWRLRQQVLKKRRLTNNQHVAKTCNFQNHTSDTWPCPTFVFVSLNFFTLFLNFWLPKQAVKLHSVSCVKNCYFEKQVLRLNHVECFCLLWMFITYELHGTGKSLHVV